VRTILGARSRSPLATPDPSHAAAASGAPRVELPSFPRQAGDLTERGDRDPKISHDDERRATVIR